jgi:hypothetical protein
MQARFASFEEIEVESQSYDHDLVIERGQVRKRSKKPSKPYKAQFGHKPLSAAEAIPWGGKRLIIGTGAYGSLPIMDEVLAEAERRGVEIVMVKTEEACRLLGDLPPEETYAILHITC